MNGTFPVPRQFTVPVLMSLGTVILVTDPWWVKRPVGGDCGRRTFAVLERS